MAGDNLERVIVDVDFVLDPKIGHVSDILLGEGKGLLGFSVVDVVVDGTRKSAVELNIIAEKEDLPEAVRRAGLTVLENAERVTE